MRNLNEQIERINRLFEYKVGVTISEQENPAQDTGGLSYIITAGASNVPMRAVTLNKNQNFPIAKDVKPNDVYLYEISLADALNDDFSKAKILNKVDEKNRDQIIFGNQSIINSGTIRIPINQSTINQSIKVSGNGALVLSRVANEYKDIKKMGGVMILELSSKELYSTTFSLEKLGITQQALKNKTNSLLYGLIYMLNNAKGQSQLDPTAVKFKDFPDRQWVSIKDLDGNIIPLNVKWSDKIANYKNSVDLSNYKTKYDALSKVIKNEIITPGLNQLPNTVSSYLSTKFTSLPKDLIDQFTSSLNPVIKKANDELSVAYVKNYFDNVAYKKSEEGETKKSETPGVKSTETKYQVGKG